MRALRTHHVDEAEFVRRVDEQQRPQGYRIVGVMEGERVVAVAGFRVLHNLAWGDALYVDDLSTLPEARGRGHGRGLLEWCAAEGQRLGCHAAPPGFRCWPGARGCPPPLLEHPPPDHGLPLRAAAVAEAAGSAGCADPCSLSALASAAHPSTHAPLRAPRAGRRSTGAVRRLGDAGAVRGHPAGAPGGAHGRRDVRRLAHGRDRDPRAAGGGPAPAAALERRERNRGARRAVLGPLPGGRRRARRPVHLPARPGALPDRHERRQPR